MPVIFDAIFIIAALALCLFFGSGLYGYLTGDWLYFKIAFGFFAIADCSIKIYNKYKKGATNATDI